MSWLAAARKRVFEMLASSASRLGARERLVEPRQLLGALADALLEDLVRALARLLRRDRLGDVGVGGDEAAVGQLVRADLDDAPRRVQPERAAARCRGRSCGGAAATSSSAGPGAVGAALRVEADDLVEPDADAHELGRQLVEVDEGAVPGEQAADRGRAR